MRRSTPRWSHWLQINRSLLWVACCARLTSVISRCSESWTTRSFNPVNTCTNERKQPLSIVKNTSKSSSSVRLCSIKSRASTPRRSRCSSAPWRSVSRPWVQTILIPKPCATSMTDCCKRWGEISERLGVSRHSRANMGTSTKGKKRHDYLATHAQRESVALVAGRRYPCGSPSGPAPAPRSAGGCARGAAGARRCHANRPHCLHPRRATARGVLGPTPPRLYSPVPGNGLAAHLSRPAGSRWPRSTGASSMRLCVIPQPGQDRGICLLGGGSRPEAPPPPSLVIHCLNGNLLRALLGFGRLSDERVQRAIDWQARSITGEGITRYYLSGTSGPGFCCVSNQQLPCALGAI